VRRSVWCFGKNTRSGSFDLATRATARLKENHVVRSTEQGQRPEGEHSRSIRIMLKEGGANVRDRHSMQRGPIRGKTINGVRRLKRTFLRKRNNCVAFDLSSLCDVRVRRGVLVLDCSPFQKNCPLSAYVSSAVYRSLEEQVRRNEAFREGTLFLIRDRESGICKLSGCESEM